MLKKISIAIIILLGLLLLIFGIHHYRAVTKVPNNAQEKLTSVLPNPIQSNTATQPLILTLPLPDIPVPEHHTIHKYTYSFELANKATQKLLSLINTTMNHLRYNRYKLGGSYFNIHAGSYVIDCSNYVDHLLKTADPSAYLNLKAYTGCDTPTSMDYYSFFKNLPIKEVKHDWYHVAKVSDLKPGDILVFRYKNLEYHRAPGHVMVVMEQPQHLKHETNVFSVRVSDSAPTRHSHDTRAGHTTGIGIGTLLLKADARSGEPFAFAWREGAPWQENMYVAMARPEANNTE